MSSSPDEVKRKVVWREQYWLTDFAHSVYNRSAGLFGNEQHSPILCISHGIPAIVCRFKEQTSKGFMWRDIGLAEWLFDHDFDEPEKSLTPAVLAVINDQATPGSYGVSISPAVPTLDLSCPTPCMWRSH